MKQLPLISVIVPIFKVEDYLDRCVSSIVNQTYPNLEIILVDDGSPDHCPAMCDTWAAKDARIKVIHKQNGGLSDARNAGMAAATGELLGFVDSDDWIAPDMYERLYQHLTEDHSDMAACGVEMVWEDGTDSRMLTRPGSRVLEREEAMRAIIEESWLKQPVWYKLYKTALVRDIPFPIGKCHEDVFWSYQAVGAANRVSVFDSPCYFYRQRSNSIMGVGYSLKRLDALEARVQRYQYMQAHFPGLVSTDRSTFLFFCLYSLQMAQKYLSGDEYQTAKQRITRTVREMKLLDGDGFFSPKQRLWVTLAKLSLDLTCRLRSVLHVGL